MALEYCYKSSLPSPPQPAFPLIINIHQDLLTNTDTYQHSPEITNLKMKINCRFIAVGWAMLIAGAAASPLRSNVTSPYPITLVASSYPVTPYPVTVVEVVAGPLGPGSTVHPATTVTRITLSATSTATSTPPSTPHIDNVWEGALVYGSHFCTLKGLKACDCGPQVKAFEAYPWNDTTAACPEAVNVIQWGGVPKVVFASGSIWHLYATNIRGSPKEFGPMITCPHPLSCEPRFIEPEPKPAPPPKPKEEPWSTCTATWAWAHVHYEVCGGGDWPEGSLGEHGDLAEKLYSCGGFAYYNEWYWKGPNSNNWKWCYKVSHLLGAKNCMGSVLRDDYHQDSGECSGPG